LVAFSKSVLSSRNVKAKLMPFSACDRAQFAE